MMRTSRDIGEHGAIPGGKLPLGLAARRFDSIVSGMDRQELAYPEEEVARYASASQSESADPAPRATASLSPEFLGVFYSY